MEEEIINEAPKRPQFLKVLLILTFIGTGVGILGSIFSWWGMRVMSQLLEQSGGDYESLPGFDPDNTADIEKMMAMMPHSNTLLISGILFSVVCLVGALFMWNHKKTGFYIYCVGELAPIFVTLGLLGMTAFSGWGIFGIILPILFVVLYAANLKHLS